MHKLTTFSIFIFAMVFLLDAMDRDKISGGRVNFAGFRQKSSHSAGLIHRLCESKIQYAAISLAPRGMWLQMTGS